MVHLRQGKYQKMFIQVCMLEGSSLEVQPWHRVPCGGDVKMFIQVWMLAFSSLEMQPWHRVRCGGDVEASDGAELRLDAAPGRLVHLARPLPHDLHGQGALVVLTQHLGGRQAGGGRQFTHRSQ